MTRLAPQLSAGRARAVLLAGLVFEALAIGCAPEVEHDWYVSRFSGVEPARKSWKPEKQLKIRPQKKPAMVIYEVTQFPEQAATPEQQRAAATLLAKSRETAERRGWYDYGQGIHDGYHLVYGDDVHYVNEEYLFDDGIVDPERPEFLMYYDTSRGKSLVGFMYYVREERERGPQLGGPLTVWHYHVWSRARCFVGGILAVDITNLRGECAVGEPLFRSPEMLHVWLVDHPHGDFATRMRIAPPVLERLVKERGY